MPAHAIDRTWTGNGANNKWSTAANWSPAAAPVSGDRLIFGAATVMNPTNDIPGLTIIGMEFQASGFTLTGAATMTVTNSGGIMDMAGNNTNNIPLVLSGPQSVTNAGGVFQFGGTINNGGFDLSVGGAGTVNFNAVVSGNGGLTLFGDFETVRLGAAHTFAGGVTIDPFATVLVGNAGAFPNGAGRGDVVNNGTINLNGTSVTMNGLYGAGTIDNQTGTAEYVVTVGNNSTNSAGSFSGTIQNTVGAVGITKVNTNTFTFNGTGSYNGSTRVTSGTFVLGAAGTLNSTVNIFVSPGAVLDSSALASFPLGQVGSENLFAGRTTNDGPNDIIGNLEVDGNGRVNVYNAGAPGTLNVSGGLSFQSGTVAFDLGSANTLGSGVNDLIAINGPLNLTAGSVQLNPISGSFAAGAYTLISNTTATVIGTTAGLSTLLPRGLTATFDATSKPGSLFLTMAGVASPANLVWNGGAGYPWDVQNNQDWLNGVNPDTFFFLDNVTFSDVGIGPVQLDVAVSPSSVKFNNSSTNAYIVNGNGAISGPGGLTINNGGTVTLNTANNYTNVTAVNDGTLILGTLTSAPGGPHTVVYNGVTPADLILGSGNVFMQDAANFLFENDFNNVILNPGGASISMRNRQSSSSYIYQFNGFIRNVGGTIDFNNPQRKTASPRVGIMITNTTTVNGILGGYAVYAETDWVEPRATDQGSIPYAAYTTSTTPTAWVATNNVNLSANPSASLNNTTINSLRLNGPATVTINGGQALTLSSGGLLVPGNAAGASTITGGSLQGAAGADLIVNQYSPTRALTIGSVIADNGGSSALTMAGRGTVILTGANTYSGVTYINGPTLSSGSGTAPGIFAAGTLQIGNGGTSGTLGSSPGISNNAVLAFNRSDTLTVSVPITGKGGITQLGSGTTILTANNGFAGLTTISAGTLQVGNGGTSGSLGNTPSVTDNGRIVFNRSDSVAFSPPISGIGGLTKSGTGTVTLNGVNTYQAATFVNSGTLTFGASGAPANSIALVVAGGANLNVSAVSGFTLTGGTVNQVLAGAGTIIGDLATTSGVRISPATNGVVGTLTFNNSLNLNGGTVDVDISSSTHDVINVGGNLALTAGKIHLVISGTLANGTYRLINYSGSLSGTAANLTISGFSQLGQIPALVDGVGGLDLVISSHTGANLTWLGDGVNNLWDINTTANFTNAAGVPSVFSQYDDATFNDASANTTVNLAGSLTPNLTIVDAVNNYTFQGSGDIGGGILIKKNSGTLTFDTLNSSSSPIGVTAGTLQLGDGVTAGDAGSGNLTNSAAVVFNEPTDTAIASTIIGSGTMTQNGPGAVVLIGDSPYSGTLTINSGIVQVGAGGTSGSLGTGPVVDNTALVFNRQGTYAQPGGISGPGSVTNAGLGTLVLSGANSYAGPTVIANGRLKLGASNVIPDGGGLGDVILNGDATFAGTLDLNGFNDIINGLAGTASNFWGLVVNDGGVGVNTLTVGNNDAASTFAGQIRDNTGSGGQVAIAKMGTNTVTFLPQGVGNTYSGGTSISNGIVSGGTSVTANPTFCGAGPVTFYGGTLQLGGFTGTTTPDYGAFPNALVVPAGQIGTILGTCRGDFNPASVTGSGTLVFSNRYVRCNVGGNWSAFTGNISINPDPTGGGGDFRINSSSGFGNAKVNFAPGVFAYNRVGGTPIIYFGELTGDSTSTIAVNGGSPGGVAAIWASGGLNTTFNFDGSITEGSGILKVGTGTWTLTSAAISYTGSTIVSNGVLAFGPSASIPASTTFSIASPGVLDLTAVGGVLTIGSSASQTLQGDGGLKGAVVVGSLGTIAPGFSIGTLTVSNAVSLGGTALMELNVTNAVGTNDLLVAASIDYTGGTLTVTNVGPALQAGDTFKLFSSPTLTGTFAVTNLPATDNNGMAYTWTNNLAQGIIGVASAVAVPTVNTNATNITFSVAGGQMTLSWPPDHLGWHLQAQTNALSVGLQNSSWVEVPNSTTVTQMVMQITTTNGAVFYRLILPLP